jgi:hypothetical protein
MSQENVSKALAAGYRLPARTVIQVEIRVLRGVGLRHDLSVAPITSEAEDLAPAPIGPEVAAKRSDHRDSAPAWRECRLDRGLAAYLLP